MHHLTGFSVQITKIVDVPFQCTNPNLNEMNCDYYLYIDKRLPILMWLLCVVVLEAVIPERRHRPPGGRATSQQPPATVAQHWTPASGARASVYSPCISVLLTPYRTYEPFIKYYYQIMKCHQVFYYGCFYYLSRVFV